VLNCQLYLFPSGQFLYRRAITNYMVLSPSWEAVSLAATHEIPSILWNTKVHYRVHKSPPPVSTLRQNNSVHTIPFNLVLSTQLCFGLPSGLFPSGFPTDILSRIRGSMTNNNGFWIWWLDLLTTSFTVSLNRDQLHRYRCCTQFTDH
jgi:hypothetical protein